MDDFKDHCGEGPHPLLSALQSELAGPPSELDSRPATDTPSTSEQAPQNSNSEIIEETKPELIEDNSSNVDLSPSSGDSGDFKVVCYFTVCDGSFPSLTTTHNYLIILYSL